MKLKELASKYIQNAEHAFSELIIQSITKIDEEKIGDVIETAKNYLEDAKHYREKKMFKTSLASVAYCEGLLDALRLLEIAQFSW